MTAAFTLVAAVLLLVVWVGVYVTMANALLDVLDTGLRFRAANIETEIRSHVEAGTPINGTLAEPHEQLTQVVTPDGAVLQASPPMAARPALPVEILRGITRATVLQRTMPEITGTARLLIVPAASGGRRVLIIVGASMQDRADALELLVAVLGVTTPLALAGGSAAGWRVAGSALRPVEELRRHAAAVAVSDLKRRLPVPPGDDEIVRLARTFNEMLGRLQESFDTERQFLDLASHELRTPLAALTMELELALAGPRTPHELRAALESVSEEADRLNRLAGDLLILSRAQQGRLPIRPLPISLWAIIGPAVARWKPRACGAGVTLMAEVSDQAVLADSFRVGQALDNLLHNSIRYTPAGGTVVVRATSEGETARISVLDSGPGFPEQDASAEAGPHGTGLGLPLVQAIARAHGGSIEIGSRPEGGAYVNLDLATIKSVHVDDRNATHRPAPTVPSAP